LALKPRANVDVREIIQRSDIVAVATALGLQIDRKETRPRKALCPFHDDRNPSLNLYQRAHERDNFHCFACGADGDVVSLVQRRNGIDFWDAVKWLAPYAGVSLAEGVRRPAVDRRSGAKQFAERVRGGSDEEELARIAEHRGFAPETLRQIGAGVYDLTALRREASGDRVLEEALCGAGILRPEAAALPESEARNWLRGFYSGKRIVFPLGNGGGAPAGFAARALGNEDPRYLYSFDFPRRDTLYGAERVEEMLSRRELRGTAAHIYVVEGIFDQLRVESLGFEAVALLGSRAATGQVAALARLAEIASQGDRPLQFRLFLDPDTAGRDGAYDLILSLLRLLDGGAAFGIEVVIPPPRAEKADPDTYLRGQNRADAAALLDQSVYTALEFMLGVRTGQSELPIDLGALSPVQFASSARRIAHSLAGVNWDRVLAPLAVGEGLAGFAATIRTYGDSAPGTAPRPVEAREASADPRADLITALTVGRSSTQRREYPLDDEAWERLAVAASPLFHIHRERLRVGDGPMAPLLARHLPKGGGRNRLKAGPVAADALLQQYTLIELLRDRPGAPGFSNWIPAVRYDRRTGGRGIYRTGAEGETEALSFAYQVDMGIVNGEAPPVREGIFRPYFECWRAFIDHLDGKIRRYRHEDLQILRLDITGFYEYVRRDVIGDALQGPLERALAQCAQADRGPLGFAPLLLPDAGVDAANRANVFTDFLLRHAFHSEHADPETGNPARLSGLPQGPDLSAYLANISLFDLDDMMRAEVRRIDAADEENDAENDRESRGHDGLDTPADRDDARRERRRGQCSAAYARYVDDIIIVCPSADVAGLLRRKIETHLQLRGLSLNRKNPTPPLMTREEAREWLTDSRTGFGFSGPLADMPVTDTMDPLADAGDIDRRTALGLLFDPELDDLRRPERIYERLERAFRAAEVRFGDRANAYRRLWLIAAGQEDLGAAEIARSFRTEALRVDVGARMADAPFDIALAALEAIERALRAHIPDALEEDARDCWADRRVRLAKAVLADVFAPLATAFLGAEAQRFLDRHDVCCQVAIIACLALSVLEDAKIAVEDHPFSSLRPYLSPAEGANLLPEGLRLSLYRHDGELDPGLAGLAVPSEQQARSAFRRLETALVSLQRLDGGAPDLSPAPPTDTLSTGIERVVENILKIWTPGAADETEIDSVEVDAAATLVNVTYRHFATIAPSRPRLIRMIANQSNATALPSPPGLEASGLLLWCATGQLLFAAPRGNAPLPVGAQWRQDPASGPDFLHLWKADLAANIRPLVELETDWDARDIASLYEGGYSSYRGLLAAATEQIPVPTAFSFFAPVDANEAPDIHSVTLICWTAPRAAVDGHAFVRNGRALEARPVHLLDADHWRYGWAVRDLCRRPEGPAEDIAALEGHGDTKLDRVGHRRDAILARVLPRLSGADRWGAGLQSEDGAIPTRIARALRLLTAFGTTELPDRHATYLVAATAEGVFMSERLGTAGDTSHSGRPAAIAARAARRVSRALPAAGRLWPDGHPLALGQRRSASAWFAAAHRVEARVEDLDEAAAVPLAALGLGLTLLGTMAELRALAFEMAAALPVGSLERLRNLPIDLSFVTPFLGGEIALIDDPESPIDGDPEVQTRRMLRVFGQIIEGRRTAAAAARDAITPLGWLILVSTLLQVTPPATAGSRDDRPALWRMTPDGFDRAAAAISALLPFVAAAAPDTADDGDWPWNAFAPLCTAMPEGLRDHLAELSAAAAIRIDVRRSTVNPRTGEVVEGRPVLRLADGSSHRLSEWQIDVAFVAGERRLSTECDEQDGRIHYRYSVAWNDDRVVGLHLVSQSLAEVAFCASSGSTAGSEQVASEERVASGPADPGEAPSMPPSPTDADKAPSRSTITRSDTQSDGTDDDSSPRPIGAVSEPLAIVPPKGGRGPAAALSPADAMARIIQWQDGLWRARAKRGHGLQRLAMVQWDVADTYYAPGTGGGKHEGLRGLDGKAVDAKKVNDGGVFQSVAEARRRVILREVLRACARFNVDGLVLPEYSLRAETVNWLTRQLVAMNLSLTIWCGTFRVPDGTSISTAIPSKGPSPFFQPITPGAPGTIEWDMHSALLTCIDALATNDEVRIRCTVRHKRYPSPAAGELIRPSAKEVWQPMLTYEKNPFRLGTYTVELVCSEMFLHASTSNFIGILEENRSLALRYAIPWPPSGAIKSLNDDMHVFARWTSYRSVEEPPELSRGKAMQRTLIILPAMTSRSADYHIFGQNQYLAAGLVTAFCNAVEPTAGVGGSAFIGLDGWKSGMETATPYGSLAPGIYQLESKHSGALGAKEAAMVIADIDPIRTTDLKPRPHYQARSLQLVAHLPLVFATEVDPSPDARGTRERMPRKRFVDDAQKSFIEAATAVQEVLDAPEPSWRHERAASDTDPVVEHQRVAILQKTVAALDMLVCFADDPEWLRRRAAAFREKRWHYSPPSILPALIDWLYVDDSWRETAVDLGDKHPLEADENVVDVPRDCGTSKFEA
jgi:DNA primase catalytic core